MNAAEINIDCLRAAESLLRDHDARIATAAGDLRQLRRDRVTLAERVQHCIDILCGRAHPDLFTTTPPAEPEPTTPPAAVTPPLAPGEVVELDVIRAAVIADIAAVNTDPPLLAVAEFFADEHEMVDVGDLWDRLDMDFPDQGGMSRNGLAYAISYLAGQRVSFQHLVKDGERFAAAVFDWLKLNGHEPAPVEKVKAGPPAEPAPGPIVCKPVGEGALRDIPGITEADADKLDAACLWTLADLEAKCGGDANNSTIYRVLVVPKGPLMGPDADRVANAVTAHLNPATVPPAESDATPAADQDDPAEPDDLTAEEEQRVGAKPDKSPGDERKLKAMAEWRKRQAAGDTTPTWGLWAEFAVYLDSGAMVAVLYDPGDGGVEFHGEATSESGYHLEYSKLAGGKSPKKPLAEWAKAKAEDLATAVRVGKAKAAKQKLKAPPAKAGKPKSKGKGAK